MNNLYPLRPAVGDFMRWYYTDYLCKRHEWQIHQCWRERLAAYHVTGIAGVWYSTDDGKTGNLDPYQFGCYEAAWEVQYVGLDASKPRVPKHYGQLSLF